MDERQPFDDIAAQGAPAGPDALKAIVARHQRGRTRTLGVLLAVALVAGPIAGWAIGNSGGGGQQVATGSQPDGSAASPQANAPTGGVAGNSAEAFAITGPNAPKLTHLFTRTTADGITIRAYQEEPPTPPAGSTPQTQKGACIMPKPAAGTATAQANSGAVASANASSGSASGSGESGQAVAPPSPPNGTPPPDGAPPPCPGQPPICKTTPSVLAELSNDAAVGQSFDAIDKTPPTDALSHLSVGAFGGPEGTPAVSVTVQTGPGVATVRLRLPSGATDEMAPSGGVAVLAHGAPAPTPDGTVVEALDGSGKVLASMPVSNPTPKMGIACGMAGGIATAPRPAAPPTTR